MGFLPFSLIGLKCSFHGEDPSQLECTFTLLNLTLYSKKEAYYRGSFFPRSMLHLYLRIIDRLWGRILRARAAVVMYSMIALEPPLFFMLDS